MWDGVDEVTDRSDIEWVHQGKLGQVYRAGQVGSSLFLFINAFDDPILGGRTPPFERISPSTFVSGSITGLGGHLGWLDGEGIKTRWVLKPVKKILTTAKRDSSVQAKNIDAVKGGERCPAKEVDGIVEDWR
ncbi:hypothetical protein JCM24511_09534 [Saitozyma sp. JCM 24511]|nr:hypothetical protein JCM24511_09534 [Saitozyma sp. JCM 24511]